MKKVLWRIGFGFICLLVGIFIWNKQEVNHQKIAVKNPEILVDKSESQKPLAVSGTVKKSIKGDLEMLDFETALTKKDKEGNNEFTFEIKNIGKQERILHFTSSQRYDYEIYEKSGNLVTRYSDGKSFLQVIQDISIAPNESLSFDIRIPRLDSGEYSLVVWPTAKGTSMLRNKIEFIVK
ncbi:BsuPI-related putative proteinase inhibitor [Bacillus sp. JJ1533]|uniref:BsuPI-related putative proteinase inhibitor n=1 Tax=Bacillus sp. JJ1533 TaxID=3122959 RepID=UPI002FFE4AA4